MTTVRKIIDEKADTRIYTVPSSASVFDALQVMCEGNTGAVMVSKAANGRGEDNMLKRPR